MKTLIIGGSGFVGHHMQALSPFPLDTKIIGSEVDIRNKNAIRQSILDFCPSYVVNLAAISTVNESKVSPRHTYDVSFYGTLNILESLAEVSFNGTFLYVSSSEVYGHPDAKTLPLSENSKLSPMSPYAVGKLTAENICSYWAKISSYKIIVARPFTHIGPGQSDRFSISSFAKQIAQIKSGRIDPVIKVGNLETTRDLTDVRDIVSAYWLLLEKGATGEIYNISSGMETSIRATLKRLIQLSDIDISIKVDSTRLRAAQQQRILGNSDKVRRLTSWERKFILDETLKSMISHWMAKVSL
jgi:GDP-4-dehydro-6-deoxy-D-mannose reductase